ncbi:MAG: recombinase family protein [Oscillospiraceae bacterium]|nr:recombinase family protein [Oscillospiraceae bacterium]
MKQERLRAAAYCRVSTKDGRQLDSLENQKLFFEKYTADNGIELVKIYADEGISGKQMKNRTEFLRMIDEAGNGSFETVLVKDVSRFARNTVDFLSSIRRLKRKGVEVCFLSNSMTNLGSSEFILTIFGAAAQEESANISKRIKFGKDVNARKGRVPNVVYGYRRVSLTRLEKDPSEAETVKEMYRMYTESGWGCVRIARELDRRGTAAKRGGKWEPRTVHRILCNPLNCGELINHKSEIDDFLEGSVKRFDSSQWYRHSRPELAIISRETYERAMDMMKKKREKGSGLGKCRSS